MASSTEGLATDEPDAETASGAVAQTESERAAHGAGSAASAPAPANRAVTEDSGVVYRALPAPLPTELATPSSPACATSISGSTAGAPSAVSEGGVAGTTTDDLESFAARFNQIRVANCLPPVPFANIRYDSCMEQRLFWMAEDPSTDPMSAWGHIGSQRS
ncbi:MAG: hypothetical protein RJQ01_00040, partial [Microcella sp.]